MVLAYRSNAAEKPRPPVIKAPDELIPECKSTDMRDWRPRTLPFKRKPLVDPPPVKVESVPAGIPPEPEETDMTKPKAKPAKAKRAASKAKPHRAKAITATKKPGVVATIIKAITKDRGASADEIAAVLEKAFPDRAPEGMLKTVYIQAAKHCDRKERDPERGMVYFKR